MVVTTMMREIFEKLSTEVSLEDQCESVANTCVKMHVDQLQVFGYQRND